MSNAECRVSNFRIPHSTLKLAAPDGFAPPASGVRDRRSAVELQGKLQLAEGVGNAPTLAQSQSCFRDRCSQLLSACLPKWCRVKESHLQPSRSKRDTSANWANAANLKSDWRSRQDSNLQPPRSKRGALIHCATGALKVWKGECGVRH